MKKITLLFIAVLIFTSVESQNKIGNEKEEKITHSNSTKEGTEDINSHISFLTTTIDYGSIYKGDKEEKGLRKFKFTNTGTKPIFLTRIRTSCGCTSPEYSKEAILPGEDGYIDVRYRATGKGKFSKSLTVFYKHSNEKGSPEKDKVILLKIKGEVFNGMKDI